ncbi:hypothetical protein Plano_0763 [Planococcus sp. PAMC 21323]|nr:hypothetical protein Plano_0763 [Planococcus sp. PAMC 21323]
MRLDEMTISEMQQEMLNGNRCHLVMGKRVNLLVFHYLS